MTSPLRFKRSHVARAPLLEHLNSRGIDGWLLPIEKYPVNMEVCISGNLAQKLQVTDVTPQRHDLKIVAQPGTMAKNLQTMALDSKVKLRRFHEELLQEDPSLWHPMEHMYLV